MAIQPKMTLPVRAASAIPGNSIINDPFKQMDKVCPAKVLKQKGSPKAKHPRMILPVHTASAIPGNSIVKDPFIQMDRVCPAGISKPKEPTMANRPQVPSYPNMPDCAALNEEEIDSTARAYSAILDASMNIGQHASSYSEQEKTIVRDEPTLLTKPEMPDCTGLHEEQIDNTAKAYSAVFDAPVNTEAHASNYAEQDETTVATQPPILTDPTVHDCATLHDHTITDSPFENNKRLEEEGLYGRGLLYYRKWWERSDVDISVNGDMLSGIPVFTDKNTLRIMNDIYSYFIPLEKIDYIRTTDGLKTDHSKTFQSEKC